MKITKIFMAAVYAMLSLGIFMGMGLVANAEGQSSQIFDKPCMSTVVATAPLNVRSGPGTDSGIIGHMPEGTVVVMTGQMDDGWVRVRLDGYEGYVSAGYVEIQPQVKADGNDRLLLAALIQCEAGGEPYEGQVAVGAAVMNRVKSTAFPDDIYGVIYDDGQFGPVTDGKLERLLASGDISPGCMQAADEALSGVSNIGDRMYFNRKDGNKGFIIGNHRFR